MTLYLSRLTLARTPSARALLELVDPKDEGRAMDAHHRLIWSVFTDGANRERDFLWRADGQGKFFTLSARRPVSHPLFEPPETKPFEPELTPGDRLQFTLRTNATGAVPRPGQKRGQRVDVVMQALAALPQKADHAPPDGVGPLYPADLRSTRARARRPVMDKAATDWLSRQGERTGFTIDKLIVEGYRTVPLPKPTVGKRENAPKFGILDLTGTIEITDPARFLPALAQGFGRAKAFGCGLMLIRRA